MEMSLLNTLMHRDGLSPGDAQELIDDLREQVLNGEDPEDVLYSVGLEPDYLLDLIW